MGSNDYQKNQDSIVRQSTLKFVQDYARLIGTPLKLKEIVGITNVLVDYCQNGYSKDIADKLDKVDNFLLKKFDETI